MKNATGISTVVLMLALGLTACGDSFGPEDYDGRMIEGEWSGHVAVGKEIEIKGISGDIEAFLTTGSDVVVSWIKRGQQNDPTGVTIDVVNHVGGVTICAVYPDVPGEQENECGPGMAGHMATRENDVEVDFVVLVPAGVDFTGRAISGDILARDLQSDVFGSSVNGNIDVTTAGLAEGSTVSGWVDVMIGRTDWDGDLEFSAVSGNVTVSVSENTSAEVWATSVTGIVSSDFSLPRLSDGSLRGNIGSGGGLLRLSTVSGNVTLKRTS